jgi:Fe-S-cluster containining protein
MNALCKDCGACCFEQGSPTGYLVLLNAADRGEKLEEAWGEPDDISRFKVLPAEALADLCQYRTALMAGFIEGDVPCCWFDEETLRCRYYEWRPEICRELKPGSEGCQGWRDEYNVDVVTQFA